MLLTQYLEQNAQNFPNNPALTMRMGYRTVTLTYGQVYKHAQKVALFLEKHNVNLGDKVLLLAPNSPYWICVFWGCLLRGAILVPLNIQSTGELVNSIIKHTNPKLFFSHSLFKHTNTIDMNTVPTYKIELLPELIQEFKISDFRSITCSENDLIEILYTSGTTGTPKGVMLTHKNLDTNLQDLRPLIPFSGPSERLLSILPLSHILEQLGGFLVPYSVGAHIIYTHSFSAIRPLLQQYKITRMFTVPEFLKVFMTKIEDTAQQQNKLKLLHKMQKLSLKLGQKWLARILFKKIHKQFGGHLKTFICGGAPLDPILEKKWNALGIEVMQGYGLTETSPVISTNSYEGHKLCSVGKVMPSVSLRLDTDGNILVKGPSIFTGYYKNDEKTQEAFTPDGYFKTGDIGELDTDGFLFLRGRKTYMILGPGGQNVHPEDLEQELNKQPDIIDSCVLGLEKPDGNMEIHAVLLCQKNPDTNTILCNGQKIIDSANSQLTSYQQIASWSLWPDDDFPRSATRKVKKNEVLTHIKQHKETLAQTQQTPTSNITPITRILAQLTGNPISRITPETKVVPELGLDSLLRIELIMRIEEELRTTIEESKITSQTTVSDLEDLLKENNPVQTYPALKKWPRWRIISMLRMVIQIPVFLFLKIFVKLKVTGQENLQNISGPVIFMPNHISYLDPAVVTMALPFAIRYKLAQAAAHDVLYNYHKILVTLAELIFNSFSFPRTEHENIKQGLDHMGQLVDKDYSILIFPEGKISENLKLLPLKRGAGLVAIEMGIPVIPVKITGANIVLPCGKHIPCKRSKVTIIFGKPLIFSKSETYIQATEKIAKAMNEL
ncbi:MAG: AMP-binding protein [bacterium]